MNWSAAVATLTVLVGLAAPARAQAPVNPPSPPLSLRVTWDLPPHTLSTARNFEGLYALYGRGMDAWFGKAGLDRGNRGIFARLAKSPLDAFVAWLATLAGHEFGHCQQAWLAGSHDCHWIAAPGPYALGHIISIGDGHALSPAGRMGVTAGGTQASVAAADALKRAMFAAGDADWTSSALLAFRQLDLTLYGLTAPSPADAASLDYANDMTNYAAQYGSRSGLGGEAVHADIVRAALWNAGDAVTWYAIAGYFRDYVVRGRRTWPTTGVHAAGLAWTVTTNAWLSEVGVRYSLGVFARPSSDPRAALIEVTPSWGEGQPAIDAPVVETRVAAHARRRQRGPLASARVGRAGTARVRRVDRHLRIAAVRTPDDRGRPRLQVRRRHAGPAAGGRMVFFARECRARRAIARYCHTVLTAATVIDLIVCGSTFLLIMTF